MFKKNITENFISIQRLSDNAFIPMDEANSDYQEYLEWEAQQPVMAKPTPKKEVTPEGNE